MIDDTLICKFKNCLIKHEFLSGILWKVTDDLLEHYVGIPYETNNCWASRCRNRVFTFGKGMPGRVLESGTQEWVSNVQKLPYDKFPRLPLAVESGIKTVANFAVKNKLTNKVFAVVELCDTKERLHDQSIVNDIMNTFNQSDIYLEKFSDNISFDVAGLVMTEFDEKLYNQKIPNIQ